MALLFLAVQEVVFDELKVLGLVKAALEEVAHQVHFQEAVHGLAVHHAQVPTGYGHAWKQGLVGVHASGNHRVDVRQRAASDGNVAVGVVREPGACGLKGRAYVACEVTL